MYYGFDVSQWNGSVNMEAAKSTGKNFVIIRSSYGNVAAYPQQVDSRFLENVKKAKAALLDFGIYHYSYATTVDGAKAEARGFIELLDRIKPIPYFVALDIEDATQANLPTVLLQQIIKTFIEVVEQAGYFCALYSYEAFLSRLPAEFRSKYAIWCANIICTPSITYGVHQYSFTGSVSGINGAVDLNKSPIDYVSIIKNGGYNGYHKEKLKQLDTKGYKRGMHKLGIVYLKQRLKALGYRVDNTNGFGGGTEQAVNELLSSWGFEPNGIAGENFAERVMKVMK